VKVAIDAAGNALAIWRQLNTGVFGRSLWVSRYVTGSGWSAPALLENDDADIDKFTITMQADTGRATVVWTQLTTVTPSAAFDVWARTFEPASGWGSIERVESMPGMATEASAGIDSNGNTIVAWSQLGNNRYHVWANRHTPASGWGAPTLVEAHDVLGDQDTDARIAVAPSGDALTVWQRSNGSSRSLWTNSYHAGSWRTEQLLVADSGANFSLSGQQIAMDANGNALLVWGQWQLVNSIQQSTLASKRYAAGWQNASAEVSPGVVSDLISHPRLAVNAQGAAAVIWGRKDLSIQASVATAGGPWGQVTALKPADTLTVASLPAIGIDGDSNAFAVWDQSSATGGSDIWINRYTTTAGWGTSAVHENTTDPAQAPALAINDRGDAVVAWTQLFTTGGSRIVARHYSSH
jgi:hypothetical protein